MQTPEGLEDSPLKKKMLKIDIFCDQNGLDLFLLLQKYFL